jgi:Flp pilus assembly protein TadD
VVRVFDLEGRRPPILLEGADSEVHCLAFSPDGQSVAAGGDDKRVRVWDLASGQLRAHLTGHTREVEAVAFSPDSQVLVSASAYTGRASWVQGGEVMVWLAPDRSTVADAHRELEHAAGELDYWLTRGREAQEQANYGEAREILSHLLEIQPTDQGLWTERARVHYRLGRFDRAATDYRRAWPDGPESVDTALHLGGILLLAGDPAAYREVCRHVLEKYKDSKDPNVQIHVARLCSLGPLPDDLSRQAVEMARSAVAARSSQPWFRRDLANAELRAGLVEEAIRDHHARLASGDVTNRAIHWLGLALAHHKAGRVEEAREWFARADAWVAAAVAQTRGPGVPGGLHENDWIVCQVLYREAAGLLKKPD